MTTTLYDELQAAVQARKPNFDNLLAVLRQEVPERPTLFEFFLNARLYEQFAGGPNEAGDDQVAGLRWLIKSFRNAGYDYCTTGGSTFSFPTKEYHRDKSMSQNDCATITDRASFEAYNWLNPDDFDYSRLEKVAPDLPDGMKLVVNGPGGVLENVTFLMGFDNMCFAIADEPEFAQAVFDAVGSRLVRYYELSAPYTTVGAMISNDDWGHKTQTMLSVDDMRKYVFPWHKRIVETIHAAGKPAILHSCGNLELVMDDIIDDMGYDGKHSYEDTIMPVEDAYERWGSRIAILGGIDVDFICRSTAAEIRARSQAMLQRAATRGSFALGTGNSVPYYVPDEGYYAMTSAAMY